MCNKYFFKKFAFELFGIGNDAGSIISDALNLVQTFQRISATKTFATHFSNECYKMFAWAKNIFDVLLNAFYFRPLDSFDLFYIYNYGIPIAIIMFATASVSGYSLFPSLILYSLFLAIGVGIGFIQINTTAACSLIIIPLAILLIFIFFCFKRRNHRFPSFWVRWSM